MEWFEIKYTDEETLEDYSADIKAESAESAKRIFETEHKPVVPFTKRFG